MSQCINKKKFDSEESALAALDKIRGSQEAWLRDKVPRRAYGCDVCQGWHLTAMTKGWTETPRRKRGVVRW